MLLPRTLFAAAVLARRLQCYLGPRWTSLALIDQFHRSLFRFCTSLMHLICMFSHSFTSYISFTASESVLILFGSAACLSSDVEVTFTLLLGNTITKTQQSVSNTGSGIHDELFKFSSQWPVFLCWASRLAKLLISIANHNPSPVTGSDRDFALGTRRTKKCDLPSTLRHAMPSLGAA